MPVRLDRDRLGSYARLTDLRSIPAFKPSEPFLELHREPRMRGDGIHPVTELMGEPVEPLLERRLPRVSPVRERIDELKQGHIKAPLIERKRLDVPTHELAEKALGGQEQTSARLAPTTGAVEKRAFGADRPQTLGLVAPQREAVGGLAGEVAVSPVDLGLETRTNLLELRFMVDGSMLRHRAIVG